jgi:hypothetical protein
VNGRWLGVAAAAVVLAAGTAIAPHVNATGGARMNPSPPCDDAATLAARARRALDRQVPGLQGLSWTPVLAAAWPAPPSGTGASATVYAYARVASASGSLSLDVQSPSYRIDLPLGDAGQAGGAPGAAAVKTLRPQPIGREGEAALNDPPGLAGAQDRLLQALCTGAAPSAALGAAVKPAYRRWLSDHEKLAAVLRQDHGAFFAWIEARDEQGAPR